MCTVWQTEFYTQRIFHIWDEKIPGPFEQYGNGILHAEQIYYERKGNFGKNWKRNFTLKENS